MKGKTQGIDYNGEVPWKKNEVLFIIIQKAGSCEVEYGLILNDYQLPLEKEKKETAERMLAKVKNMILMQI